MKYDSLKGRVKIYQDPPNVGRRGNEKELLDTIVYPSVIPLTLSICFLVVYVSFSLEINNKPEKKNDLSKQEPQTQIEVIKFI